MKRCYLFFLVFLLLATSAQAVILDIDQVYQEMTQWCWAATSQSVLRYYDHEYTQTQIAEYGTDGLNEWNWLYGETTNPTRRGIDMILYHFAELESNSYSFGLNYDQANTQISAMKPVFVRWGWNSGGGHFVVIKGLEGNTTYLMDPWYGPTINTFAWTQEAGGHTWTHTLTLQTAPVGNQDAVAPQPRLQSYPNPFNESITILTPAKPQSANLCVYNLRGQLIRELCATSQKDDNTFYSWDGRDLHGVQAASGIYLGKLQGDSSARLVKMVKLP